MHTIIGLVFLGVVLMVALSLAQAVIMVLVAAIMLPIAGISALVKRLHK